MNFKFDFDDISLVPDTISDIDSRAEVSITCDNGFLPLFAAPMDTVVCDANHKVFSENLIRAIRPRVTNPSGSNVSGDSTYWFSYSLQDFESIFIDSTPDFNYANKMYALIDVANGHMSKLLKLVEMAKVKYGDSLVLMAGNIAYPETYRQYANAGLDYLRVGIGGGQACLTSVHTGVFYPMASLISEIDDIKVMSPHLKTKVVADGGFRKYSDIIKALALGADYVMLGSVLNKALESAGTTFDEDGLLDQLSEEAMNKFSSGVKIHKKFRGMSTKEVQKDWGKINMRSSEGIVKEQLVEYTVSGWVENFCDYLRSSMSYCGAKNLNEFIGQAQYVMVTNNAFNRYNK